MTNNESIERKAKDLARQQELAETIAKQIIEERDGLPSPRLQAAMDNLVDATAAIQGLDRKEVTELRRRLAQSNIQSAQGSLSPAKYLKDSIVYPIFAKLNTGSLTDIEKVILTQKKASALQDLESDGSINMTAQVMKVADSNNWTDICQALKEQLQRTEVQINNERDPETTKELLQNYYETAHRLNHLARKMSQVDGFPTSKRITHLSLLALPLIPSLAIGFGTYYASLSGHTGVTFGIIGTIAAFAGGLDTMFGSDPILSMLSWYKLTGRYDKKVEKHDKEKILANELITSSQEKLITILEHNYSSSPKPDFNRKRL